MRHFVLDARTATPRFPGIGRYVSNLARAMVPQLGPDERMTVLYNPWYPLSISGRARVQVRPFMSSPFSTQQQWAMPAFLRQEGAALYHSPYYVMPLFPGVPSVLTVYDVIPLLFPEHSSLRARLAFGLATRLALRASDSVIALSEATRNDFLQQIGAHSERIKVVTAAADPAFSPQPEDAVQALQIKHGLPDKFVLYLGSNKPHKNLVRLIDAWREVETHSHAADYTLIIAGVWDKRYPQAQERAEALGLRRVRFLGHVIEPELPALFSAADFSVFPSLYEGFGLPVLEAMACGTPVISSNAASLPEVAGEAAWLVNPRDVDALADALVEMMKSPDQREYMTELGLAQAARFSWKRSAAETLSVYRELTL